MAMNQKEMAEFGLWVKSLRERMGLTQRELAERAGVSFGTIQTIEIGKARTIGDKVKSRLRSFFDGRPVAVSTLKTVRSSGIEHILPIVRQLAAIVDNVDFNDRIAAIMLGLGCSRKDAISILFEKTLQK